LSYFCHAAEGSSLISVEFVSCFRSDRGVAAGREAEEFSGGFFA